MSYNNYKNIKTKQNVKIMLNYEKSLRKRK